ncbi:MAG TPA: HDIG domain-containing protein [Bacteroidia bacterium]|nr:HDIG domain-containing protein [Bacteroidia bacterium]HNT80398.1 HDIG domain-containing protein [Bacteroidia bacterium]
MRKAFIIISNQHDHVFRGILIVLSIVLITFLLPRNISPILQFSENKIWMYDDLYSPQDITIRKSEIEIAEETDAIRKNTPLCYTIQNSVVVRVKENFIHHAKRLQSGTDSINFQIDIERFILQGDSIIDRIYQVGVLQLSAQSEKSEQKNIALFDQKKYRIAQPNEFYSIVSGQWTSMPSQIDFGSALMQSTIESVIESNIIYNQNLSERFLNHQIQSINLTLGVLPVGSLIIKKGETVDDVKSQWLNSYFYHIQSGHQNQRSNYQLFGGYLLMVSIAIGIFMVFLFLFRSDVFFSSRKLLMILVSIVFVIAIYSLAIKSKHINALVVPVCILPIIIRAFFDTRIALFSIVVTSLILGMIAPNAFDFVYSNIITGMVAIFTIVNLRHRGQIFFSAILIFITYILCYAAQSILYVGNINKIDFMNIVWLGSSALLTLLSYPLIFAYEKIFGLVSDVKLMELNDPNNPLLQKLSIKAPGTFHHSLQVANLAEAAVHAIGGQQLLVRVGALYHDIGKLEMPQYFIENQGTQINPHDELSFDESARIIISHVIKGIELARKEGLPDQVIDFIRTHHGTTMVQYFYQSFLKNFPEEMPNTDDFRYKGPKPYSKETAVLMMADSVEAASRSLRQHDAESIAQLVESVLEGMIVQNQFENCDITYKDITTIKNIFRKKLQSIYHTRIQYPA